MKLKIYKSFLAPYLIFISFNAAFALSEYLQIYVLASIPLIIFFLINLFSLNLPKNLFQIIDLPIILFSINNIFIFFINPSLTALNYLIVYSYTFVFIYFSIKYYLLKIGWESFIRISNIGLYLVILFVIISFIIFQITGVNIQSFIPRIGPSPDAIMSGIFLRAYGFSNEPTNLSAYFLSFGLLAIFHCTKYNKKSLILLISFLLFSFILTYSSGLFASIFLAFSLVIVTLLIDLFYRLKIKKKYILYSIIFVLLSYLVIIFIPDIFYKIVDLERFMYSRGEFWSSIWSSIIDSKFTSNGFGSAGLAINWYLMLIYENGLISLILIFTYLLLLLNKIKNSKLSKTEKLFFYFGLIAVYLQLNSFSTFYYPFYLIYSLVVNNIIDSYKNKKYKLIKNKFMLIE